MKTQQEKFFKVCPKSGKVVGINNKYFNFKWLILLIGLVSTIWYLFRVLPKPGRVTYPCMQAVSPFVITFIGYVTTLVASAFGIRKVISNTKGHRMLVAGFFIVFTALAIFLNTVFVQNEETFAAPSGELKFDAAMAAEADSMTKSTTLFETDGYTDKTVARVYDPTVSTFKFGTSSYDYYWRTFDVAKLQSMLERGIMEITGEVTAAGAWRKILPGVTSTSKVAVKVNHNNVKFYPNDWYRSNVTNPPTIIALVKSLEQVGIQQANITFMDPSRSFPSTIKNEVKAVCPNVVMMGNTDNIPLSTYNYSFSEFTYTFKMPKAIMDASYFIDLCVFKYHNGGITASMKNLAGLSKDPGKVLHDGRVWENNKTCRDLILNAEIQKRLKLCIAEAVFGSQKPTEYLVDSKLTKTDLFPNNMCNSVFVSRNPYLFDNVLLSFMNVEKSGSPSSTSHTRGTGWIRNCAGQRTNWSSAAIGAGTIVNRGGDMPPKELAFDPNIIEFISVRNGAVIVTPPAAPSNLTATATSCSQVKLTWTDNSNNESNFKIERSVDGITWSALQTVAANATSYTNSGLAESTVYQYRVMATNSAGNSAYTPGASATTPQCPVVNSEKLWMEAEAGTISSPMTIQSDAAASGGKYIMVTAGNNSQAAAPTGGSSVISFTAQGGTYNMWVRTLLPSGADNSFWIKIDNNPWISWNLDACISTAWQWNQVTTIDLAAGPHTVTIAYREDGSKMDRVLFTNDASFVPTGTGETVAYDNIAFEAESGTISSPMTVQSDAAASGGKYIMVAAGNNSQTAAPANGYSVIQFNAAGGDYSLWAKTMLPGGGDNSFWVKVDNQSWFSWNVDAAISTTWKWNKLYSFSLTPGAHTLTIAYREDGSKMDRVAISNDPAYDPAVTLKSVARQVSVSGLKLTCAPTEVTDKAVVTLNLPESGLTRLELFNLKGQKVKAFLSEHKNAGNYSITIDAAGLERGMYILKLTSGKSETVSRIIVK